MIKSLGRRWASVSSWVYGNSDELEITASVFLSQKPPPATTLVVNGSVGSGKSFALDQAMNYIGKNKLLDPDIVFSLGLKNLLAVENITSMAFIDTINRGVGSVIAGFEKKGLDRSVKVNFREQLDIKARKLFFLRKTLDDMIAEENPEVKSGYKEETQKIVRIINEKIKNYPKVVKLDTFDYDGLKHIIDRLPLADAFEVLGLSYLVSGVEEEFGELTSALQVATLQHFGQICQEDNHAYPVLRIDDTELFYQDPSLMSYFKNLVKNLSTSHSFYSILEGSGNFSEVLRLMLQNPERFQIFCVKDYPVESVESLLNSMGIEMTPEEFKQIYSLIGGSSALVFNAANALSPGGISAAQFIKQLKSNVLREVNQKLATTKTENQDEKTWQEKFMGIDQLKLRASLYIMSNLMNEPLEIEPQEFSENYMMQQLCLMKLLYYDGKHLDFDKPVIKDILPYTQFWNITKGYLNNYKNSFAYNKILSINDEI